MWDRVGWNRLELVWNKCNGDYDGDEVESGSIAWCMFWTDKTTTWVDSGYVVGRMRWISREGMGAVARMCGRGVGIV